MPTAVERMEGVMIAGGMHSVSQTASSLDKLVLRVRDGDVEAFDELMIETQGRVLGLAWKLLGDKEQAKDACQEAFLRAFKFLGTYRIGESFTSWIGRIVANVCTDYMRKREYRDTDTQILEQLPAPDGDSAENAVLLKQRRELLERALKTLTPSERSALVLRDIEGLSTDETARVLGLRAGTIRTQIVSARIKIKDYCQSILHSTKGGRR